MPLACAALTVALAALPFGLEQLAPRLAVPAAFFSGAVFVAVGFTWRRVVGWAWGRDLSPKPGRLSALETADKQIWSFFFRAAYPAFVLLGLGLPAKFLLAADPMATVTLQLSGVGLVVVVLAWFSPLWTGDSGDR